MSGPASRAILLLPVLWCACVGTDSEPEPGEQEKTTPKTSDPWFVDMTRQKGVDFHHESGIDGSFFFPEHVGSGGALFDADGDGDLDLYLINSGPHGETQGRSAAVNRLYRQEGNGSFVDRTAESGLGDPGYGMGVAVGDYDGDGDVDVYVTNYGPDRLYRNEGDGRFSDVTAAAGLGDSRWSTSACFFDADRDGDLDLYAATYVNHDPSRRCTDAAGRPEYCGPAAFRGEPDLFYRNEGDQTFTEIRDEAAMGASVNKGLGVVCADLDGDGMDDVYVANDGEKNDLWLNLGGGRFEDRSLMLGAGLNAQGKAEASMGIALGDLDADGDLDLFVSHLDRETNTLYRNLGDAGFADATAAAALGPDSLPYTGFGTAFADVDLDRDLDLLIVNGRVRRGPPIAGAESGEGELDHYRRYYSEPNLLFENLGGSRFENRSDRAGELCSRVEVSRAALVGDIDRDGDPDVVVTNCNGPARLYRNELGRGQGWLQVRSLLKTGGDAVGGRVTVVAGGVSSAAPVTSTHSYLAATEPVPYFGLGPNETVDRLEVRWPGGSRQRYERPPARRRILLYSP